MVRADGESGENPWGGVLMAALDRHPLTVMSRRTQRSTSMRDVPSKRSSVVSSSPRSSVDLNVRADSTPSLQVSPTRKKEDGNPLTLFRTISSGLRRSPNSDRSEETASDSQSFIRTVTSSTWNCDTSIESLFSHPLPGLLRRFPDVAHDFFKRSKEEQAEIQNAWTAIYNDPDPNAAHKLNVKATFLRGAVMGGLLEVEGGCPSARNEADPALLAFQPLNSVLTKYSRFKGMFEVMSPEEQTEFRRMWLSTQPMDIQYVMQMLTEAKEQSLLT